MPVPTKSRRQFTTPQKVAILHRHLVDKAAISDICAENDLQPSVFYAWQRQAFANLAGAFEPAVAGSSSREKELERENEALKARLTKKDSVIAEISEEYVTLKKQCGGL